MRHTSIRYGYPAQVFPWATVALLLILVPVAWVMVDLPSRSWRLALGDLQESIGVALLTLSVIRLAWRLNWQTFRTLVRSDLIGQTEGIGVRDVTILFTDLVGSTTLYAQIGDRSAFSLVQLRIPRQIGPAFQFEGDHHSDLKPVHHSEVKPATGWR